MAKSTSQPFRLQVVADIDGTHWRGGNGAWYRGSGTFKTLQSIVNGLDATTGGWAQMGSETILQSAFPTRTELAAIAPSAVLHGTQGPAVNTEVWASASWNGYGWYAGAVGGHYSYWGNEMYMVRIADPPAVTRMYDPAPIAAVAARAGGGTYSQYELIPSSAWGSISTSDVEDSFPAWGPRATHQYSGTMYHGGYVWMGGSNQNSCTNPTAIGLTAQLEHNIWRFNPNAATPKSAWTKIALGSGASGVFGLVVNADGTFSARGWPTQWTINPATMTKSDGIVGSGPRADRYTPWRWCWRDPATGKYYECHQDPVGGNGVPTALYEDTASGYVKRAALPTWFSAADIYEGDYSYPIVEGNKMFLTDGSSRVMMIDLTTYAISEYSAGGGPSGAARNGVHGRWGYVPQVKAFVMLRTHNQAIWVFRPPASWRL